MTALAVAAALLAVGGAVAALSARDGRVVALGILVSLVAGPFVAPSLPESLAVAPRVVGGTLAAYLAWAAARSRPRALRGSPSPIGLPAALLIVAAAFAAGLQAAIVSPLPGAVAAQAAGFAILVPAVVALLGRNVFRIGLGAAFLALAAALLRAAWLGAPAPLEELAMAGVLVGLVGGSCVLATALEPEGSAADAEERTTDGDSSAVPALASPSSPGPAA